jgi:hypothetical protein
MIETFHVKRQAVDVVAWEARLTRAGDGSAPYVGERCRSSPPGRAVPVCCERAWPSNGTGRCVA